MAIVLALLIIGWLVAFAVGAQAGFEASPEPAKSTIQTAQTVTTSAYSSSSSVASSSVASASVA